MTKTGIFFEKKALNTIQSLIYAIKELKLEETLYSNYETICKKDELAHLNIKPRKFEEEDWGRLKFEILCYTASHCLQLAGPRYFSDKKELFSIYSNAFQDHLYRYINLKKLSTYHELVITGITPTIQYGYGECLNPRQRIIEYFEVNSAERKIKLFCRNIGYALDPYHFSITEIIALSYLELIINISETALKHVFEK